MGVLSASEFHVITNVSVPTPFLYGLDFDALAFIPIAVIFLISSVETAGTSPQYSICNQPVHGSAYVDRVRRGVLADGVNSLISATLNSFPNTTFSQNNGNPTNWYSEQACGHLRCLHANDAGPRAEFG